MKKLIKLMADYQCYPLWEYDELGLIGNLNPESLPISRSLIDRLDNWSSLYDKTLCLDNPVESGFSSYEDELYFKAMGEGLAKELKDELEGKYNIIYNIN